MERECEKKSQREEQTGCRDVSFQHDFFFGTKPQQICPHYIILFYSCKRTVTLKIFYLNKSKITGVKTNLEVTDLPVITSWCFLSHYTWYSNKSFTFCMSFHSISLLTYIVQKWHAILHQRNRENIWCRTSEKSE